MMSSAQERDGGLLPLGRPGTVAYCTVLTLVFLFLGFPFDRLGDRLVSSLSDASGAEIRFTELSGYLSLAGPGFEATDIRFVGRDSTQFDFDRLRIRPAWSLAWFLLTPAVHLDVEGPLGRVVGTAVIDRAAPSFEGVLEDLDLTKLPIQTLWPEITVSGSLNADIVLTAGSPSPEGSVQFEARDGGLGMPGMPGMPFESVLGEIELGGEALVRIISFRAQSPMFTADVSGQIGMDEYFVRAPLDFEIKIQAQPRFAPAIRAFGLDVDSSGAVTVHLTGTPSSPQLN